MSKMGLSFPSRNARSHDHCPYSSSGICFTFSTSESNDVVLESGEATLNLPTAQPANFGVVQDVHELVLHFLQVLLKLPVPQSPCTYIKLKIEITTRDTFNFHFGTKNFLVQYSDIASILLYCMLVTKRRLHSFSHHGWAAYPSEFFPR